MADLIHLPLLLMVTNTIQLPEATSGDSMSPVICDSMSPVIFPQGGINVTFGSCFDTRNITCAGVANVWQLKCSMESSKITLTLDCIKGFSDSKVLEINITTLDKPAGNYVICNQCRYTGNVQSETQNCLSIYFTSLGTLGTSAYIPLTSVVNLKLNDSTCGWSATGSGDIGTGPSLVFYDEPKTWIEALKQCRKLNSSLVQITNQTMQNVVTGLLKGKLGLENGVWVGLERSIFGTDLDWMWTSRSKSINPKWNSSFPVDRWNNHCGKIIWNNGSGEIQLLDANCHDELLYICQSPM